MKKDTVVYVISVLFIFLFSYTATSKLADMSTFAHDLHSQPFGKYWAPVGKWVLPILELLTAICLVSNRLRNIGLWSSLVLMTVFSIYILLILSGIFPKRPCSCAGVFKGMGWLTHFLFNLVFVSLAWIGVRLVNQDYTIDKKQIFLNQKHVS